MAERVDITVRGEIFYATREASDISVLWGELFGEKERKLLREHLQTERIAIPLLDTFSINVRTLWQPEERDLRDRKKAKERSKAGGTKKASTLARCHTKKVVVVLHAASGVLTSSWAWMKLGMPLFKLGHSVVFIDLPGFGSSSCGEDPYCPMSRWKSHDYEIVQYVMDRLEVDCGSMLATGEGCSVVMRMLQMIPAYVKKYHIFHNPIFKMDELFPEALEMGPGGMTDSLQSRQQHELEQLLASSNCRIWSTSSDTSGPHQEAYDVLYRAAQRHPLLRFTLAVTTVTREHICAAQAGCRVPVSILFPCKFLRKKYVAFLDEQGGWMPGDTLPEGCAGEASSASSSTAQNSSREVREGERGLTPTAPRSIAGSSSRSLPSLRTLDTRRQTHAGGFGPRSRHSSSMMLHQLPHLSIPEGESEGNEASARQVPSMADFAREAAFLSPQDPGAFRQRHLARRAMEAATSWNQRRTDIVRSLDCDMAEQPQILQALQESLYSVQEDEERRTQKSWTRRLRGLQRLNETLSSALPGLGRRGSQG